MFDQVVRREELEKIASKMEERNFQTSIVSTKNEALEEIKNLLPKNAEVMTGSSTTLDQIGFSDFLASEESDLVSLHGKVNEENDQEKRQVLRRKSITADYFLASVNAITSDGVLVAVDQTGSRVGALPYGAGKLILVVGAQKVTANIDEAMRRVREFVFPLEDKRALAAYGSGTSFGKWVIIENEISLGRIHVILVEESLGF